MARIELQTVLAAPIDTIWDHVLKPEVLFYVAHGMVKFRAIDPPVLPQQWQPGTYRVSMLGFGVVPLGHQVIDIEFPKVMPPLRMIRDNGHGRLFRTWDHRITLTPESPGRTIYADSVDFDSGALTSISTAMVRAFYAHRQRRWHRLVSNGFDLTR